MALYQRNCIISVKIFQAMPAIEVGSGTKVSLEDILGGISRLDSEELDQFVEKVLALRAKQTRQNLSQEESALLKKINRGLPVSDRRRLTYLDAKRSDGKLSEEEYEELLSLIEVLEQLNAERVELITELAQMRGIPARELMQQLGIRPHSYG